MSLCHVFSDVAIATVEVAAMLLMSGCASTKWAMDDDRYAYSHSSPYSADPVQRLRQQTREAMDARFQEGNSGAYVAGGATNGPWPAALGEIGAFWMPSSWGTMRLGAIGVDDNGTGAGGAVIGAKVHAPTRLTPYVGVSSTLGFTGLQSGTARHNSRYARQGQRISTIEGLLAIVPEAGVSYWVTPHARLNVGASYYVTDGGRPDFLLYGVSMEFATRPPLPSCDPPGLDYGSFPEPPDPGSWVPTVSNCGTYVLPDEGDMARLMQVDSQEPKAAQDTPRALSDFDLPETITSQPSFFTEAPSFEGIRKPE